MQYSPKLKKAMQEIMAILDREDIAGCVVLHTPQFSEYHVKINPSYSCARFEGDNLRVKAKLQEDFNGDKNLMQYKVKNTVNMLNHLAEDTGRLAMSLIKTSEMVDEITKPTHFGDGHSSHTQQNN